MSPGVAIAVDAAKAGKPIDRVIDRIRAVYGRWGRDTAVARMRDDWDALFASPPDGATEPTSIDGIPAVWVVPPGPADRRAERVVLYFHGGGFQVGSTRSHRRLMAEFAQAGECHVLGIDYRLAPEHRHPAALQDACAAYEWLLAAGWPSTAIAFAGDSAGANLALTALLSLRDRGRPLPACAVLLSAWTDLAASGASYETRAALDPIHQRRMIVAMARSHLGPDVDPRDPSVSPLYADLRGLPPLLMQVGDRETVLSDSTDFADKARAAGVAVDLEIGADMIHVYQQFPDELAEARTALRSIGRFLQARLQPRESALSVADAVTGRSR